MPYKRLFIYIIIVLIFVSCTDAKKNGTDNIHTYGADKIIQDYEKSLGLNSNKFDSVNTKYYDSIFAKIATKTPNKEYYELARIVVDAHVSRNEIRKALSVSDEMYSKAKANDDKFGISLSNCAISQIKAESGLTYDGLESQKVAYDFMTRMGDDERCWKIIILMEGAMEYIEKDSLEQAQYFVNLLNASKADIKDMNGGNIINSLNAYFYSLTGDRKKAELSLDKIKGKERTLPYTAQLMQKLTEANLHIMDGHNEKALQIYNSCLADMGDCMNTMGLQLMKGKAELLEKMGRNGDAYNEWQSIWEMYNSKFKTSYSKEVGNLIMDYQADYLRYQNTLSSSSYMRACLFGVAILVVLLIIFVALVLRKIIQLKKSQKRLEEERKNAVNSISKTTFFLSNMSHEIRTPLNAIVGFSSLLTDVLDSSERNEYLDIIQVNCHQLLKLINDILDLSDLEEGCINLNVMRYEVVKICRDTVNSIKQAVKTDVDIRFETDEAELYLDTDDVRLRQVLTNLLMNATKFTKEGFVVLRLEKRSEGAYFTVTDTGCGIPKEKRTLIFDRFEKLNEFAQGTGLGLSICSLIVVGLNGRIWVDDGYDNGARFCVLHPLPGNETNEDKP